jgi:hypothetical protein
MASMARDYHNNIQSERADTPQDIREAKIETVLGRTARKTTPEQTEMLEKQLTIEDAVRIEYCMNSHFRRLPSFSQFILISARMHRAPILHFLPVSPKLNSTKG